MKSAFILIDIQNDYFPGGAMELGGMSQAAAQARGEAHPALGNWHRPELCRTIFAPLFLAARSFSRSRWSRCWTLWEALDRKH